MSAIMKWVLLSIAVHVLVFGANWIVNSFETKYQDMRSIELHLASRPRDNEPIPEISDTGASKKKTGHPDQ